MSDASEKRETEKRKEAKNGRWVMNGNKKKARGKKEGVDVAGR